MPQMVDNFIAALEGCLQQRRDQTMLDRIDEVGNDPELFWFVDVMVLHGMMADTVGIFSASSMADRWVEPLLDKLGDEVDIYITAVKLNDPKWGREHNENVPGFPRRH